MVIPIEHTYMRTLFFAAVSEHNCECIGPGLKKRGKGRKIITLEHLLQNCAWTRVGCVFGTDLSVA